MTRHMFQRTGINMNTNIEAEAKWDCEEVDILRYLCISIILNLCTDEGTNETSKERDDTSFKGINGQV